MGACEKYHGAVIEHIGHEHTRVFRECAKLGEELQSLGDTLLDARNEARVGIVFDWDNWWAVEYSSGPSVDLKYLTEVQKYYDAFHRQNIPVDMIGVETDLENYDLVIAPLLYMVKPGYTQRLEAFVEAGGSFVTTFFSGIVNETDLVTLGGYPGELRPLLGIWAEEIDALTPEMTNQIVMEKPIGTLQDVYTCVLLCDLIHAEGAKVLATYGRDFYQDMPVLTRNAFGKGQAWYVASSPEPKFLEDLALHLCTEKNIEPLLETPIGVEVTRRNKEGENYLFLLNHNSDITTVNLGDVRGRDLLGSREVTGSATLPAHGVMILQLEQNSDHKGDPLEQR